MKNRLFCTFSSTYSLEDTLDTIISRYDILFNKIFVLRCSEQEDFVITYNVDTVNIGKFLDNTILVHRKKHTNTLYTINALNELIISLNNGILDKRYDVDWTNYRNCILLTKENRLVQIKTKIHKIIEV